MKIHVKYVDLGALGGSFSWISMGQVKSIFGTPKMSFRTTNLLNGVVQFECLSKYSEYHSISKFVTSIAEE